MIAEKQNWLLETSLLFSESQFNNGCEGNTNIEFLRFD